MHNHSYENEFNLHVNEISFSYERMSTRTRFEKEAKGYLEMASSRRRRRRLTQRELKLHEDKGLRHARRTRAKAPPAKRRGKGFGNVERASWLSAKLPV